MASKKLTKWEEKLLRAYSLEMPIIAEDSVEVHVMTGKELKEFGYVEQEGKPLIDDKKYDYKYPVVIAANHYRRLKKAWLKDGEDGLKKYFERVKLSIDNHKKEQLEYAK